MCGRGNLSQIAGGDGFSDGVTFEWNYEVRKRDMQISGGMVFRLNEEVKRC